MTKDQEKMLESICNKQTKIMKDARTLTKLMIKYQESVPSIRDQVQSGAFALAIYNPTERFDVTDPDGEVTVGGIFRAGERTMLRTIAEDLK